MGRESEEENKYNTTTYIAAVSNWDLGRVDATN